MGSGGPDLNCLMLLVSDDGTGYSGPPSQHEDAWGSSPRYDGGGGLLLRRRWSAMAGRGVVPASSPSVEWGGADAGENRALTLVMASDAGVFAPLPC